MKKLFSLLTLALLTLSAVAGTYAKVTTAADLTDGTYLIVYENGGLAFDGSLQVLDAPSNTVAVTIENGSITTDNDDFAFTIDVTNGTIKSASGFYVGQTTNANGLKYNAETAYSNTISIDDSGNAVIVSGGAYMRYNASSGQERFRYFKSETYTSQKAIALYKLGGTPVDPVDPTYTEVANLAAANALDSATVFKFKGDAVVTYQNGKYLYLRDGSGYGLIYNKSTNITPTFNQGDILAKDWTATKTTYDGYAEYIDYSTLSANGTNTTLAEPQVITALDNTLINAYVQINNVVSISGTTATLANGTTITLYKRFDAAIPTFENGNYYIRGIVSEHNGNLQLLFIGSNYEAPTNNVATLVAANGLTDGTEFTFTGDAVVTYQNGKYLYLRDNSGYGLIFNNNANITPTFNQGDVLAQNWTATKTTYQGYAEYTGYSTLSANGTNTTLAEPQVITALNADLLNAYVKFNNVVSMNKAEKTATLADGTTIALHTTFSALDDIENGNFSMTGIVSQFSGNLQLLLISHDYVAPAGVAKPVITPNSGRFANQVEVTITCATEGAEIIYTINGGDEITYTAPFTLTETATVKAYAQTDDAESEMAEATLTVVPIEEATYALVTDVTTLADGDKIIIVSANEAGEAYAMASANKNYFNITAVNIAEDLTITTNQANVITLGAKDNNWTLQAFEGYLSASSSSSNYLIAKAEVDSNAIATIAISDTATASIIFQGNYTRNDLRYNASSTRFSCYGSTTTQAPVYIYKASAAAPEVKLGDVNKDGVIRIDDVTALIDALLGGNTDVETEHYSPANADVNGDNVIRIDDVTALIDMLLGGN